MYIWFQFDKNLQLSPSSSQDIFIPCHRWRKPQRDHLATHHYFSDYKAEQSRSDDWIKVYRGLGDEDFPEVSMKGSLRGSILQKLSIGSTGSKGSRDRRFTPDQHGLLVQSDLESSDVEQDISTRV